MHSADAFFDVWADFYDADYRDQEIGDVSFYRDLATAADGPVLEVACGTGRVYLELLRAGVDADGIDLSREMLDVLEEKAGAEGLDPSVWRADMRTFEADREYALIVIPFRSFLHNVTVDDQLATLESLRAALAPGGRLAFNVFMPSFEVICETYGEPDERRIERGGERYRVIDMTEIADEVEQVAEITRRVEQDGEVLAGGSVSIAIISKAQFELLFRQTGWSDWQGYGGFDREPLEDGAMEMVWILEK